MVKSLNWISILMPSGSVQNLINHKPQIQRRVQEFGLNQGLHQVLMRRKVFEAILFWDELIVSKLVKAFLAHPSKKIYNLKLWERLMGGWVKVFHQMLEDLHLSRSQLVLFLLFLFKYYFPSISLDKYQFLPHHVQSPNLHLRCKMTQSSYLGYFHWF